MMFRLGRDLRKVGNAKHLMEGSELAESRSHRCRNRPTDARIDFVKYQDWNLVHLGQHRLECQHDTREFPTRCHPTQWSRWFTRIVGEKEFHSIAPNRSKAISRLIAGHRHLKDRLLHF